VRRAAAQLRTAVDGDQDLVEQIGGAFGVDQHQPRQGERAQDGEENRRRVSSDGHGNLH